jgi:hypothetical protein
MSAATATRRVFRGALLAGLLWAVVSPAAAQVGETSPPRSGEDPEISRMHVQAVETNDPDQKAKIYKKILDKDPGNAVALQGYKEALAGVEQKRTTERERSQKDKEKRDSQSRGRAALVAAETAFLRRDIGGARAKLNEARSLGQSGPDLIRVERLISAAESRGSLTRNLGLGAGGVVLVGLILWLVSLFRKGQPYIELVAESGRGRRYPIDKDVLTVGAVAEYQGDPVDVVVPDPEKVISRLHCAIHRKGRDFYVVDYSSNGTRLDGREIPKRLLIPLKGGTRIHVGGDCTLKFGFERRKR